MTTRLVIDCESGETTEVALTPEQELALQVVWAQELEITQLEEWKIVADTARVQILQTDWIMAPPSDTPPGTQGDINQYKTEWTTFREELRALAENAGSGDPAAVVWPVLPPAPAVAIVPPPPFVNIG